jgi:hypothetical protein
MTIKKGGKEREKKKNNIKKRAQKVSQKRK